MTKAPAHALKHCAPRTGARPKANKDVPLAVLPSAAHATIRMGGTRRARWRAAVLIGVHVLIAIHILQWIVTGMTLSPVEPSESMYTLEMGEVNAGFVFFSVALLSTFLFGRFFCGWACHVVALQDLCGWIMTRMGVRPKPFRARLLLLGPLLLGLYMFVWPTFKRAVLLPVLARLGVELPPWFAATIPFTGFTPEFIVEDFWSTFPPWYIAVPFLLVCGFATVYLVGSKGFCTYACPYGGFFGPIDRVSVGRIVVSDACEGCGHCTAVCTSNVRVHQEVRDFGMVVDPGCMKCMDCVSTCPNEALSFSFARPSVLAKPRTEEAKAGKVRRPDYDLSWPQEIVIFVTAIAMFWAFRGMLDSVPMLMAGGLGIIGAFFVWKLWSLIRDENVRLQSGQLKHKGRLRPAAWLFIPVAVFVVAAAAWSGHARFHLWWGDVLVDRVDHRLTAEVAFAPNYRPADADRAAANTAMWHLETAGAIRDGGWGWAHNRLVNERLAWLHAVAGNPAEAEKYLARAVEQGAPSERSVYLLAQLMSNVGKQPADFRAWYRDVLRREPGLHVVRAAAASFELTQGNTDEAAALAERIIAGPPRPDHALVARACEILLQTDRASRVLTILDERIDRHPQSAVFHATRATTLLILNRAGEAIRELRLATELDPRNSVYFRRLAEVLGSAGQINEAEEASRRADELEAGTR